MALERIDSIADPRVAPYRDLKDRELAAQGGLFIAEGAHVARRLLASDFPVHSLLLAEHRVESLASLAPPDVPVYVAGKELVSSIVGYKFHSGVLACGRRKPLPEVASLVAGDAKTLLVCPEIINHDNLGSLIRIAAAFGVSGMILGEQSCDPFWRRSIRVSMGAVFSLPILRSDDLMRDLTTLQGKHRVQLIATVLDRDAEPLTFATRPDRIAILLGSESQGLEQQYLGVCDRRVTIPMSLGIDSLNVSIAAAVFLYHFTQLNTSASTYRFPSPTP